MKKLLILQMRPEDVTADSEFEAILRVGGITADRVHRVRLEKGIPEIDLGDYSAVIAGGSPFDVSKPKETKSRVQLEIEAFYTNLFEQMVPADFPFLGCCSGNGLLGRYCGAHISGAYSEPIGSVKIHLTEAGKADPLLAGLPESFDALVGHKEACDILPPGTTLLAGSASCPVQMFRIGKNLYATQFHPEADAAEFVLRIKTYDTYGYFPPEDATSLIEKVRSTDTPVARDILRRFVKRYHKTG